MKMNGQLRELSSGKEWTVQETPWSMRNRSSTVPVDAERIFNGAEVQIFVFEMMTGQPHKLIFDSYSKLD